MKPILSVVYVECRTWKMYINTLVEKTEKMVFFYENISLLLDEVARPNASTLPSRKFASPSKVAIIYFCKLARPF